MANTVEAAQITDLTGTTWVFKDKPSLFVGDSTISVPYKLVDLKTLEKYSSISLGTHQVSAVARGTGFFDSIPSTPATFINGYEITFDTISNCTYTPDVSMISAFENTLITFTPNAHYLLPETITVSGNADHTWDSKTGKLTLSNVKSNISVGCEAVLETFPLTVSITNGTWSPSDVTEITYGDNFEIWLTANTNYRLPDTVIVTGATYIYNKDSSVIYLENVTEAVNINVECVQSYTITVNITNGSYNGDTYVDAGSSAQIVIIPDSNYSYPTSVTVTGADYDYNPDTGIIMISNPSEKVIITANCITNLATPTNVNIEGKILTWNGVENATMYKILADDVNIGRTDGVTDLTREGTTIIIENANVVQNETEIIIQ